jgi:GNAT superfamily N-acetyltransferase
MIPIAPALGVRTLAAEELPGVVALINRWLPASIYSLPMDESAAREQILRSPPPTHLEVRWKEQLQLCAWRAGELVGFLDVATGQDSEHLDLPEYEPHGILRFLGLTDRPELVAETYKLLLHAAEEWWRERSIGWAVAFHISTGYPSFQAGAGLLPGDWSGHVRYFTAAGWNFSQRYYALTRSLGAPVEEQNPLADLSLVQHRTPAGRRYTMYYRRVETIAHAKVVGMDLDRPGTAQRVAHLVELWVADAWRNRNLGKLLLRRVINDVSQQGYQELIAFLPMNQPIAMNLLVQNGFQEVAYRGYSLERSLTIA